MADGAENDHEQRSIYGSGPHVRPALSGVEGQTIAEDDAFRRIENTRSRFLGVVPLLRGWLPRESDVASNCDGTSARGAVIELHTLTAEKHSASYRARPGDTTSDAHTVPVRKVRRARIRREW